MEKNSRIFNIQLFDNGTYINKKFVRIAILDLGTNTFHLLIADVVGKKFQILHKSKIAVKLGEGAIHHNWIAPKPFRRGINTLKGFASTIKEYKVKKKIAYATSAIRGAQNGVNFIQTAKKETGIQINIIDGLREAELICYGVRQCVQVDRPFLIIDIGGGSTEFIIADDKKIFWKKSFDIGAARLLELFRPSDPITTKEIKAIEAFLEEKLFPLKPALLKFPVDILVGSSGSFDTFAEMIGYRFKNKNIIKNVNSYKFDLNEFNELAGSIIRSNLNQRLKMKGLIKMRVDMIVVATICTNYILRSFPIKDMYLSKYALKEGALWDAIN